MNLIHRQIQIGLVSFHDKEGKECSKKRSDEISGHSKIITRSHKHHYSPPHVGRSSYSYKESRSIPYMSPVKNHKTRHVQDELQGEIKKIKPLNFDGENKKGEQVES